jgi:hypothetical protein
VSTLDERQLETATGHRRRAALLIMPEGWFYGGDGRAHA